MLVVRRGRDGKVLRRRRSTASPARNADRRISCPRPHDSLDPGGPREPKGCATEGNYIDTWGRTLAFDVNLKQVWDRKTWPPGTTSTRSTRMPTVSREDVHRRNPCTAGGTRMCSLNSADPRRRGGGCRSRSGPARPRGGRRRRRRRQGNQYRTPLRADVEHPSRTIDNPQQMTLARLDPGSPTPIIAIRERGTVETRPCSR